MKMKNYEWIGLGIGISSFTLFFLSYLNLIPYTKVFLIFGGLGVGLMSLGYILNKNK
ncbi:MAG: hypothetical protein P8M03_04695 [Flavobacteriaceae bacterium]|nr:hypothetical protein [Flavobacteriaceae bacterium]